jgi:integrase
MTRTPSRTGGSLLTHTALACGALQPGDVLPTLVEMARRYDLRTSTVHRSFATLKGAGLIEVTPGKRAVVSPSVR